MRTRQPSASPGSRSRTFGQQLFQSFAAWVDRNGKHRRAGKPNGGERYDDIVE